MRQRFAPIWKITLIEKSPILICKRWRIMLAQLPVLSACFKSVKDVGNYVFCPDKKEAKPKSYLINKILQLGEAKLQDGV
jgi:hypothetical protein